jgi:hypothetical protein
MDMEGIEKRVKELGKSDPRFMKPGDAELEKLHFDYFNMSEDQKRDVIGELSW